MLLRWRATKEGGEFGSPKEPVGLLRSLQQNSTPVPAEQLAALSNVTGVSADVAASIIYMIRANACEVHRGGKRAGCALSALRSAPAVGGAQSHAAPSDPIWGR